MSLTLTLIVIAQVYFLGNISPVTPSSIPEFVRNQPELVPPVGVALRQDYTYTPGIGGHKVHTTAATWKEARRICQKEGADLAIINSAAESAIIKKLLEASRPHTGSSHTDYAFIGFDDIRDEGVYKTINDELLSEAGFYEWASGEPNDGPSDGSGSEDCGTVYRDGKLNDAPCHQPYGFVCELLCPCQAPRPAIGKQADAPIPAALRRDYTYTPGIGGHKVHTTAAKWKEARQICQEEGADLAIINSAAESAIIKKLLGASRPHNGSSHTDYAFIGFDDIRDEGVYKTINDELLSETGFYEWASGEPNDGPSDGSGSEDCGTVYRDGKLNDAPCHQPYGFVCELLCPCQDAPTSSVEIPQHPEPVKESDDAWSNTDNLPPDENYQIDYQDVAV